MKAGQFTDEQIVGLLRQAESGTKTIRDLCRDHNITETTFYRWRKRFGSMDAGEATRTRDLERENARLKRLCVHASMNWQSAIWKWMCSRSIWQKSS